MSEQDISESPDIRFVGVSKWFGDVVAVDKIDLSVERGAFFSFLGPSGCGKTTSLRLIAGFDQPTEGDVFISGTSVVGIPSHKRPVNMVFQNYALFPHMNVADNIAYGLRQRNPKPPKQEIAKRVDETLELVRLSGFGKRKSWELSGGQQQRVALARALINHPTVLLLDEPLAALDRKLRREMQMELQTLQREVGITFILVTHDQEEALTMSDRIAVMDQGTILQVGPPREIYERPGSRKVASFIGQMNLLEGIVTGVEKEFIRVDTPMFKSIEMSRRESAIRHGDEVTVAIRPESLTLSTEPQEGAMAVALRHSSYYGESTYCVVGPRASKGDVTVSMRNYGGFEVTGDELWLSWRQEDFVLLEA